MTRSMGKDAGRVHVQDGQEEAKLRAHPGRNYADLQQQMLSSRATAEVSSNVEQWSAAIQCDIGCIGLPCNDPQFLHKCMIAMHQ